MNDVDFVDKWLKDQSCVMVIATTTSPQTLFLLVLLLDLWFSSKCSAPNEANEVGAMLQSPKSWSGLTSLMFLQSQLRISADTDGLFMRKLEAPKLLFLLHPDSS